MAEFALGLTKTAVAGTVSRVKSAIEEQGKLRVRVEEDLVYITGEFQMMQSFLSASNAGERASNNQVVRTWVRQLRDLAFDVEDCVEFVVHMDKASRWDWVERLASSVLVCMVRQPLPLDVAVAEIKRLKARVEDVSQRNTRYNLLIRSEDGGSDDDSDQQLLTQVAVSNASSAGAATFHFLRKIWEDRGKLNDTVTTSDLNKLIHRQGSELQVISLWGSPQAGAVGELGWKAFVKKAYDDPSTCREFKNRAWIKLTRPFNPVEFLNTLLTHFTSNLHHEDTSDLVLQVSENKYLIVLEQELSSVAEWDAIRLCLPDGNTGSRIIVSTKHLGIALACTREPYQVWELRRFFRDQYLYAFFPKGSGQQGHQGREDPQVNRYELDKFEAMVIFGRDYDGFDVTGDVTNIVWGIAGVGKSSFVAQMYYHYKYTTTQYELCGWVDVPHPFSLTDFCRRLLLDVCWNNAEAMEAAAIAMMEGQDPTQWCSNVLNEKKILLVVDGVQFKHDWDMIKSTLLSTCSGMKIVITRDESVATHCSEKKHSVINVKCLDAGVAVDLFKEIALDGKEWPSHFEDIPNLIISQCGGLPEIITAVGVECRRDIDFLIDINADFIGTLERMPGLRSLFCWMKSYFDTCSDELKPCIFYLLVFPPNQIIRRKRLLRRWIAEGYSRDTSGGGGTSEEKGEKLFSELMQLSILYQDKLTTKVNGFFREYIKSRPMEDNLVFALEGSCSPSSRLTGQHLTISSNWDRDETVFNSIDLSRLRSLTVFGAWKLFLASDKMKLLRVLDLEGTNTLDGTSLTDDHLEEIGKLLHRLKFLSLRGCKQITRLPDSVGHMRQLQTLDLRDTSIVELSSTVITKVHKLQYIRAGASTDTSLILLQTKTPPPSKPTPVPSSPQPSLQPTPTPMSSSTPPLTPPPREQNHRGTSYFIRTTEAAASAVKEASTKVIGGCMRRACDLMASSQSSWWQWKNKMDLRTRCHLAANGGGVEVSLAAAKGVGRLTDMHTLGVVNIAGGKGSYLLLVELKKLTQLRKLGLSGINRENWRRLCDAISGNLHHLESLSLQLLLLEEDVGSFDFACFDDNFNPPQKIKRLKVLYSTTEGNRASIRPTWIYRLYNLEKFDHDLTISRQEDIDAIAYGLPRGVSGWRFRIKPIEKHLCFDLEPQDRRQAVGPLRIECSSTLSHARVTFGNMLLFDSTTALSIHCCCSHTITAGSSSCNLQITNLDDLGRLEEVTVTGTYGDDLKRDLREQLDNHSSTPILK